MSFVRKGVIIIQHFIHSLNAENAANGLKIFPGATEDSSLISCQLVHGLGLGICFNKIPIWGTVANV